MILLGFILGTAFTSLLWYWSNRNERKRRENWEQPKAKLKSVDLETGTLKQDKL